MKNIVSLVEKKNFVFWLQANILKDPTQAPYLPAAGPIKTQSSQMASKSKDMSFITQHD
jgi:hypothetical protein